MEANSLHHKLLLPSAFLNLESVERREKITKIEYLGNEKSFLDEIKNIFHRF